MTILILLGHENDAHEQLSSFARARCEKALALLHAQPELRVLPTGAFGTFNRSEVAHGELLARYLRAHGIAPDRILPHTNSTNTVEDALCVRKIVVDQGETELVVVTSAFHMRRTKFIFRKTFPDMYLSFVTSDDSDLDKAYQETLICGEKRKFERMLSEWVDVPLYQGTNRPQYDFTEQVYQNASQEQKHYDTISLAIVTAIGFLFVYPYLSYENKENWLDIILSGISTIFILYLLIMYELTAQTARTARRIMHKLEISSGQFGFSSNYPRQRFIVREWIRPWLQNSLSLMSQVYNRLHNYLGLLSWEYTPSRNVGMRDLIIM